MSKLKTTDIPNIGVCPHQPKSIDISLGKSH